MMNFTSSTRNVASSVQRLMLHNNSGGNLTTNVSPQSQSTSTQDTPTGSTSPQCTEQSTSSAEEWLQNHYENPRFEAVYWGDAFCHGDASWTPAEDILEHVQHDPSVILTAGVVVNETDRAISIMSTIIEDGSAGGQVHVIPKGWIIDRYPLERRSLL